MEELFQIKKKRKRDNPTHRWSESETKALLEAVSDCVKEVPESFEKPSAQKFYEKLGNISTVLQSLSWLTQKNKTRNLKATYTTAANWKTNTGAGLLESGEESSVTAYILKICPYWDLLSNIFGQRKNVNPPVVYETTNYVSELLETNDSNEDDTLPPEWEPINTHEPINTNDLFNEPSTLIEKSPPRSSASQCGTDFSNFKAVKTKRKDLSGNVMQNLIAIQEKRLKLEENKFDLEKEKENNNYELKKIELENQLSIRKLELEMAKEENMQKEKMRLESEERIKKYEIELNMRAK